MGEWKDFMVAFYFVSKKEDSEKGARMVVHFLILLYKKWRRQGRKEDWFRFQFSLFFRIWEEEKMKVFSSSFRSVFLFIWRNWGEEKREKECEFFLFRRGRKKCNYIPLIFLSKRIKGRGRRRDSHFSIGILKVEKMKKTRKKRGLISFPILSVFSCKKRRKERKNEDVRVFSSLFWRNWGRRGEGKRADFVLFFIILFFLRKRELRKKTRRKRGNLFFLHERMRRKEKRRN